MWPDPLRRFEGSATDPAYLYLELAAERAVSPVNGELADIRVHPVTGEIVAEAGPA